MARQDLYTEVANKILDIMDKGIIPWRKAWTGATSAAGDFCVSGRSGNSYSLLNHMLLGFRPGRYYTFNQIKQLGASVRKGQHASAIYFFTRGYSRRREDEDGKVTMEWKEYFCPVLVKYLVWHEEQTTIEPAEVPVKPEIIISQDAEAVAKSYLSREGIKFTDGASEAYYSPHFDAVTMPSINQFSDAAEYYSTLFHELTHSTMIEKRLNRPHAGFVENKELYSREELVAEMGTAFILAFLGIQTEETLKNSAAYIQSWKRFIQDDPKAVVYAASRAEKAANFILGNFNTTEVE